MSEKLMNLKEVINKVVDDMETKLGEAGFAKLEGCVIVGKVISERIKKYTWTPCPN